MRKLAALLVCALLSTPAPARAQGRLRTGGLIVTVVDTSGAIVPGATVTVTALDDGARAAAFTPVTSTAQGVARIEGLLPGRYRIPADHLPAFHRHVIYGGSPSEVRTAITALVRRTLCERCC